MGPDKIQVEAFLKKAKELLHAGKYDFVPRRKNLQSIAECGLTIASVKSILLELAVSDYYKGPKPDLDTERPGEIWEFKKSIERTLFYIKLKIVRENSREIVKCLSFHEDGVQ